MGNLVAIIYVYSKKAKEGGGSKLTDVLDVISKGPHHNCDTFFRKMCAAKLR